MTVHELAAQFGISPRTINNYVTDGVIPPPFGVTSTARYGAVHVEAIRAWQALRHNNVVCREVVAFCREEGILLAEYVRRRESALREFGLGVG